MSIKIKCKQCKKELTLFLKKGYTANGSFITKTAETFGFKEIGDGYICQECNQK